MGKTGKNGWKPLANMFLFFTTKALRAPRTTKDYLVWLSVLSALVVNNSLAQITPPPKDVPKHKSIIIIDNNKFALYNNWINFGGGWGHNYRFPWENGQFNLGLDYNFHINVYYFQMGVMASGDRFGYYNFLQAHLAYGLRKEDKKWNMACFGGVSYSHNYLKRSDGKGYDLKKHEAVGLYAQAQIAKKLTYDVGGGLSLFAEINRFQTIIGFRIDAYFSLGYKGKARPGPTP